MFSSLGEEWDWSHPYLLFFFVFVLHLRFVYILRSNAVYSPLCLVLCSFYPWSYIIIGVLLLVLISDKLCIMSAFTPTFCVNTILCVQKRNAAFWCKLTSLHWWNKTWYFVFELHHNLCHRASEIRPSVVGKQLGKWSLPFCGCALDMYQWHMNLPLVWWLGHSESLCFVTTDSWTLAGTMTEKIVTAA